MADTRDLGHRYTDAAEWTPAQTLNWYRKHRVPEWGEIIVASVVLFVLFYVGWKLIFRPLFELRRSIAGISFSSSSADEPGPAPRSDEKVGRGKPHQS